MPTRAELYMQVHQLTPWPPRADADVENILEDTPTLVHNDGPQAQSPAGTSVVPTRVLQGWLDEIQQLTLRVHELEDELAAVNASAEQVPEPPVRQPGVPDAGKLECCVEDTNGDVW